MFCWSYRKNENDIYLFETRWLCITGYKPVTETDNNGSLTFRCRVSIDAASADSLLYFSRKKMVISGRRTDSAYNKCCNVSNYRMSTRYRAIQPQKLRSFRHLIVHRHTVCENAVGNCERHRLTTNHASCKICCFFVTLNCCLYRYVSVYLAHCRSGHISVDFY